MSEQEQEPTLPPMVLCIDGKYPPLVEVPERVRREVDDRLRREFEVRKNLRAAESTIEAMRDALKAACGVLSALTPVHNSSVAANVLSQCRAALLLTKGGNDQ